MLSGIVYERGTRKPLKDVNVFILPEGAKATTNAKGEFAFQKAPSGSKEWIVNVAGYKRLKKIFVYDKETKGIKLYLERKSYVELQTTVIGRIEKKDPAKVSLSQEEFLKVLGSNGDPIRALENLPGVLQTYDSNVAIQGSPPEDTRYLIEGHEIPFIFHFFGLNTVAVPGRSNRLTFSLLDMVQSLGVPIPGLLTLIYENLALIVFMP